MPNQLPQPSDPSPDYHRAPAALPQMRELTRKQQDFVLAFLGGAQGNATEAARQAGYAGSDSTLAAVGYENLRKPHIKAALQAVLEERSMSKTEVLAELGQIARTTVADFYKISERGYPVPDLNKAAERGSLGAVKKIKFDQNGLQLELHDRLKALRTLLRHFDTAAPEGVEEQTWREMRELSQRTGIQFQIYMDQRSSIDN